MGKYVNSILKLGLVKYRHCLLHTALELKVVFFLMIIREREYEMKTMYSQVLKHLSFYRQNLSTPALHQMVFQDTVFKLFSTYVT